MNKKDLTRNGIGLVILAIALLSFTYLVMAATDLSGYVKNIEGTVGLQNVNVTIVNSSNGVLIGWEMTDGSGFYNFTNPGSGTYNITFKKSGYLDEEVKDYVFTGGQTLNENLYKDGYGSYTVTVMDYQNSMPLENASVNISWGVGGSCPGPTCLVGSTDGNGKIIKEVPANQTGGPYYVHDLYAGAAGYSDNDTVKSSVYEGNNVNITIYLKGSCRVYGSVEDKYRATGFEKIQSAFVELMDKDNQSKLNFSETHFYNTTSASNGYYEIYYPTTLAGTDSTCKAYVNSSVSDYKEFNELRASGVDYLMIDMEGDSKINGSVYDYFANTPVNGSNINISNSDNDIVYVTQTNPSGLFSLWANGSEQHKLKVSKDGYKIHLNSTLYTGNVDYKRINITGKAWVFGYVADTQNPGVYLPNVSVNINDQGGDVTYSKKTDTNGYFSMNVSSALTYDLNFSKTGYYPNASLTNEVFSGSVPNDLGTVLLKGKTHVEGYVSDCENNLQLPSNRISQASANLSADTGKTYKVFSGSNGYYSLWIPSTIDFYNITFKHADYNNRVITQSDDHDVCMNGEVLLKGHVVDKYAVASKKNLQNAVVSVYGPDSKKYYQDTTNANGNFSVYIGYLSQYENYTVKIEKGGFYGYNTTILKSGYPDTEILDPVELTGKNKVNVTVYDDFDLSPVNNSEIRISLEEDDWEEYYIGFTGTEGKYFTNIRERNATNKYKVLVSKSGYAWVLLGPYSSSMNITTYLYAATTVNVRDPYAKPSYQKVQGADVMLYYNFTTKANYSVNETFAYMNATCNLSSYTGLNVSVDCTDCQYPYYKWNSTDTGVNNGTAQFRRIHVGNYTVTVNGSENGCGVYSWNREINKSFAGTSFTITGMNVGVTKAKVSVVIHNESTGGQTPISNALVSVLNKQDVNCTTASNGICVLDYVPSGGNVTIRAEHAYHYTNLTNYTIQPANTSDYLNDFTSIPIFMIPYPGNLSVRVKNATNYYLQDVNVTALNSTNSSSQSTNSEGYANFTQLTGFYNVTADGSSEGYGAHQISNLYIEPNVTSTLELTLQTVTLLVHVNAGGSGVDSANVTLWNLSGGIAENATDDDLTALTNGSGDVLFNRVIPDEYNLTINATLDGYEFYWDTINITAGSNYKSVDLNDFENPKYSSVGSDPSANIYEGTDVKAYSFWTDNNQLDTAILYTNITGTWGAYASNSSLVDNESWANFTIDTSDKGGETILWGIWANDTSGNTNETANQSFYLIPALAVDFEDPTPQNATTVNNNWVFVNVSVSKTPDTCVLNWTEVGGSSANYTMSELGNTCNINMTGLWNANYTYRVWSNISGGESNVSETREVRVFAKINLLVSVEDDDGNPVEKNATNNGVQVRVWNSSYSGNNETDDSGNSSLFVWPGTYNITVNGTWQGYGVNETLNFVVNNSNNETALVANTTRLWVNVTDPVGSPLNVFVDVYRSDNVTYAKNASGDNLTGITGSDGIITFNRVLPCYDCNITVHASPGKTNYTRFDISAGQNLTVHIDPPTPPGSGLDLMTVTVNLSVDGVDSSELDNITVTLSNATGSHSDTTVDGIAVISMPGGYWNVTIDGSAVGFGVEYDYDVALGKIVANSNTTNTEGFVSLQIAGSVKYYLRVEKPGYKMYDDISNGTYRMGEQTINVDLDGVSTLEGNVFDRDFYGVQKEMIDNATVNFYMATSCSSLSDENLRYGIVTGENGNYTLNISNKQTGQNTSQSYCLKITANGYTENVTGTYYFDPGYTNLNVTMRGDRNISGHLRDMITEALLDNVNVKIYTGENPNRLAYTETTDSGGYFIAYVSSRAEYLDYSVNFTREDYFDMGEIVYTIPSYKTYYMRPGGTTLIAVNVTSDMDEPLTDSCEIIWNVSSTKYGLEIGKPYCISLADNKISCWVYDSTGYLTANGTFLGYGYNNSYVEDPNQTFVIVLNTTVLNITTKDDSGDNLENVTVTLEGSFYQNVTDENGSALFVKIPVDTYNLTFSGNVTQVYFYNNTNKGTLVVNEGMSGQVNDLTYVLNETRALVTVVNETSDGIFNISVTINNVSVATYENRTNQSGAVLFVGLKPASNYTIIFNNTEVYELGYIVPDKSVNVIAGEDEGTNNTITVVLDDLNLTVDMKNESGAGIEANVTVYFNGSVAENGFGEWLNGSLSSGVITFSNVKPTEYYLNENYTVVVDANATGYGIRAFSFNATLENENNYIERNLSAMNLNVSVFNESQDNIEYNVTLQVLRGGSLQSNAFSDPLESNLTQGENSTTFTHMFVNENYTLLATSAYYFNKSSGFDVDNESVNTSDVTLLLIARKLYVFVSSGGSDLEDGVNISIVNASDGSQVTGTNGSVIPSRINVTDSTYFEFIPDGEFNVTVNSSLYFEPADYKFSNDEIMFSGLRNVSFSLSKREINIFLRNESGETLEEGVNVSIINKTDGSVIYGLDSNPLNDTNINDNVTFNYIPDGNFYINVKSVLYFSRNVSFDTSQISGGENVSVSLYGRDVDVYLYDIFGSLITESLLVEVLNGSGQVEMNMTGQPLNGTTSSGSVTFYGVPDGNLSMNASNENYTIISLYVFDGSDYEGDKVDLTLLLKGFGYFNVTVNSTDDVMVQNAYVAVHYNDTNLTGSAYTNAKGMGVVDVNTSQYSNLLNVTAYTYYGSPVYNRSGPYTLSDGEIKDVYFIFDLCGDGKKNGNEQCDGSDFGGLSCSNFGYNYGSLSCTSGCVIDSSDCRSGGGGSGPSGSSSGPSYFPSPCTEDWECYEWGECQAGGTQTRNCVDQNACETTRNKPETSRSCTYLPSLYAEFESVKINAGECGNMEVTVYNNGTVSLKSIVVSGIAECCTLSSSSVGIISPNQNKKATTEVCVGKQQKAGSKDLNVRVSSDKTEKWFLTKIEVEKEYQAVLIEKAEELIEEVENARQNMSIGEYMGLMNDLNRIIDLANRGELDDAEGILQNVTRVVEGKEYGKGIDIIFYSAIGVILAVVAVSAGLIYRKSRKGRVRETDRMNIRNFIYNIKNRISEIEKLRLDDEDKRYCEKIKYILEKTQRAAEMGRLYEVKNYINDVELMISVLESKLVSKGVMEAVRKFR